MGDGTVIDYKTGQYKAESHTRYEKQVCIYADAVQILTNLRADNAYIYYVDSGELKEVNVSAVTV